MARTKVITGSPDLPLGSKSIISTEPQVADKQYLRQQSVRRGKAGYRGDPNKIVVVDQDTGKPVKGAVKPVQHLTKLRPVTLTDQS